MKLSRINSVLALLLGMVVVAIVLVRVDHSIPNYEFLPDMKVSPAKAAYDFNSNFANGRTLQSPVEGTIARGEMPLHYLATKEDAVRAGEELVNPFTFPISATDNANGDKDAAAKAANRKQEAEKQRQASIARGSETFRIFCISCHGPKGAGDGPVPKRGFPPPPSMLTGKSVAMKDGQLFHILTYGQGSMTSFAAQLTPHRRWDVINFVRSLQPPPPSKP